MKKFLFTILKTLGIFVIILGVASLFATLINFLYRVAPNITITIVLISLFITILRYIQKYENDNKDGEK